MGQRLPGLDPEARNARDGVAADHIFISALSTAPSDFQRALSVDVRFATGERLGIETLFGVLLFLHDRGRAYHSRHELHAYSGTLSSDYYDWGLGRDLRPACRFRRVVRRKRNHDVPASVPYQGEVFRVGHCVSDSGGSDSGKRRSRELRAPGRIAVRLPLFEIPAAQGTHAFRFRKLFRISQ